MRSLRLMRHFSAEWAWASQQCKTLPIPEVADRRCMSIALPPSEYMGTKQDQGYVCEGIAETIRNTPADEHLRREPAGYRGSECHVDRAQRG